MSPAPRQRVFLTAEWRYLAMLNYPVDAALLESRVPAGCELDRFEGVTYISLVGFLFLNTRVAGLPIPFHRNFEELNLRFYVLRREGSEIRRGVVFEQEIVPRRAVATVARLAYQENYHARPMRHRAVPPEVEYGVRVDDEWSRLWARTCGDAQPLCPGSKAEFIAEHYWGYCAQRNGSTIEYRVEHEPWRVWQTQGAGFEGDAEALYGREYARVLTCPPESAFVAEGSPVAVRTPRRL